MTSTQLIVVGLMIVAFISGWVARGAPAARSADEAEVAPPDDPIEPLLAEVAAVHESVIDAWIDGAAADEPLSRFADARARLELRAESTSDLDDAVAALRDSSAAFGEYRRGAPLTAELSRRLQRSEDVLATARAAS